MSEREEGIGVEIEAEEKMFGLFGNIFLMSRKLEYVVDKELAEDNLTTKQFLTIAVIEKMFSNDYPPSVNQVAEKLSTSHQNVKQIVDQLEKKGFLITERDEKDRRVLRLKLTEKNRIFWESRAKRSEEFVMSLFSSFSDSEIDDFYFLTLKLLHVLSGPG